MPIRFTPLDPTLVAAARLGEADANGRPPERAVSDGRGNPCRCCLTDIEAGAPMLILAARPFEDPNPYAETGPVFLHAEPCEPWSGEGVPPIFTTSPDYLLKGYTPDGRIAYGTGRITPSAEVATYAADVLADERIAWVDVRSARNNCWQARVVREGP